jgi:FixJ family two-component response regulator
VCRALKRLLKSYGMQIQTFTGGQEFIAAMRLSNIVDCVVIDVKMPQMSGLEVQKVMNRDGVDVPVIFITALAEQDLEEQAMKAGAVGLLRKPFAGESLVELIRKASKLRQKGFAPHGAV